MLLADILRQRAEKAAGGLTNVSKNKKKKNKRKLKQMKKKQEGLAEPFSSSQ